MNSQTILAALRALHGKGWLFVPELRLGTGYGGMNEQRLDAWAMQMWRSRSSIQIRRAFEIKVSLSDATAELREPDKRWPAYAVSNEFYFVAPVGLIKPKLLTKADGLIEWDGEKLRIVKAPRVREGMPPRWDFVASILRRGPLPVNPPNQPTP